MRALILVTITLVLIALTDVVFGYLERRKKGEIAAKVWINLAWVVVLAFIGFALGKYFYGHRRFDRGFLFCLAMISLATYGRTLLLIRCPAFYGGINSRTT